jgi:16S rRNA (uracil1498-N3)-methyltransferase
MDVAYMIYLFDTNAGEENLKIKGESHKYLVKILRHSVGDKLYLRNKSEINQFHTYEIVNIEGRSLDLVLLSSTLSEQKSHKKLHLAWCVIDIKSIEKVLPMLNEIGVAHISFIYCERSQKNFKLDFKRFERILDTSMQQSGRTDRMEFDTYKNITTFIEKFPDTKVFDFSDTVLKGDSDFKRVLIGCEGGFSQSEKELLSTQKVFRLDTPMILRSESAVVAVASKILL